MKKILFIHSDCIFMPEEGRVIFRPGVIANLANICEQLDFLLVLIKNDNALNQNGIEILKNERILFTMEISSNELGSFIKGGELSESFNKTQSYIIERISNNDTYLVKQLSSNQKLFETSSWKEIFLYLQKQPRVAKTYRKTSETTIELELNLDGSGHAEISTGIGFLDHMITQIARHGGFDIRLNAQGDYNVDEHHITEDIAIALGDTFYKAMGSKKGIERYGFVLPMDDCLAQVAIDFSGRPWLVWDATFKREKIGEMPTEMFYHFFKSFCDTAKCNLHIKAEGENEHHKIEAIFKAFARALRIAVQKTGQNEIPSTKGVL
ncbi:MAG: imidazoleglycerol-phosphate dehydratase HisB [Chitinophagales bacterium]|nr:imidazoleglycerol-phosphate dehydratase HisB [Chitinophagales bacterium]MDW8272909.1 imidazoleglycerol-phosphate dehydratase HisB [Chitinophagales bacterium]